MRHAAFLVFLIFLWEVERGFCDRDHCTSNGCFSVVQNLLVDSASAEKYCNANFWGHLTPIKSAKEHDIILDLLNGSSGDYWIGLKLPDGKCPDRETPLLGYEWATGGNDTDFVNWDEIGTRPSCSAKCVSASAENNSTWRRRPCDMKLEGALCMYVFDSNACDTLPDNAENHVQYFTSRGSAAVGLEKFPQGSTAIQKPLDVKHLCFSGQWLKAPWPCEVMSGGCEHSCVSRNQVHSCACRPGQSLCANNVTCGCATGHVLADDGKSGESDNNNCAGENVQYINNVCVCRDGFDMGDDGECVNSEICFECEHNQCVYKKGAFTCACRSGYRVSDKDPTRCQPNPVDLASFTPNPGSECPDGYIKDTSHETRIVCEDIDECFEETTCDHTCTNTFGSYVCSCFDGYERLGDKCVSTVEKKSHGAKMQ